MQFAEILQHALDVIQRMKGDWDGGDLCFLPRTQVAVYFLTLFFYAFVEPNDLLVDLRIDCKNGSYFFSNSTIGLSKVEMEVITLFTSAFHRTMLKSGSGSRFAPNL